MASGITFSGFNSIDFGSILNAVMQQERAPLTVLESRKASLEGQNAAFSTFATKLGALQSAAAALAGTDGTGGFQATSSKPAAVGVATSGAAVPGTYDVVVTDLAQAQVTVSSTGFVNVDAVVAVAGTFVVTGPDQTSTIQIDIEAPTTLAQLAAQINAAASSPVTASVVRVAVGDYRLVLTGKATGTINSFSATLTDPETGLPAPFGNNIREAADAVFTVNDLEITSASNTITDAVPGATLTLLERSAQPARVEVTRNQDGAVAAVEKFVTAYNDVLAFIKNQTSDAAAGKSAIGRDPLVRGLRDALRDTLSAGYGSEALSRLALVGVAPDRTGTLKLDQKMFREALASTPDQVTRLFQGPDGKSGFAGAMDTLLNGYTRSGGLVADARQRLDAQVTSLRDRLSQMEEQLARRRLTLQQEFAAADRAMSQLNSQGSSLNALASQYRLF